MVARKKSPAATSAPKEDETAEAAVQPSVNFVPGQHTTGTKTVSGAVFSFTPLVTVKVSRIDADDLVDRGFGTIQGG